MLTLFPRTFRVSHHLQQPGHLYRFRRLLGATGLNLKGGPKGGGVEDSEQGPQPHSLLIFSLDTEPGVSGRHLLSADVWCRLSDPPTLSSRPRGHALQCTIPAGPLNVLLLPRTPFPPPTLCLSNLPLGCLLQEAGPASPVSSSPVHALCGGRLPSATGCVSHPFKYSPR